MVRGKHIKSDKLSAPFFIGLLVMLVAVYFIMEVLNQFVFQTYEIPSGSMNDTIIEGDMVFAEKLTYRDSDPQVGDVVTFTDPVTKSKTLIKRVVALGGSVITIDQGMLYVDGVAQVEPYVKGFTYELSYSTITYPYLVPEDCVWVMGDNRENSADSRYFGAVSLSEIKEKAVLIYWPLSHFGEL